MRWAWSPPGLWPYRARVWTWSRGPRASLRGLFPLPRRGRFVGGVGAGRVTAPRDAHETSVAYLPITPGGRGWASAVPWPPLRDRSALVSSRLLSRSRMTRSPSRRRAMGPPAAASRATCPTPSPWEAPLHRPSVSKATRDPRPRPARAAVTANISRMPGPPFGPSLRTTTTSPSTMSPAWTARKAASSPSNTRAGPSW